MSLDYFFSHRGRCYQKLRQWGYLDKAGIPNLLALAELLGAEDVDQFANNPTEDQKRLMKLLSGPNGYIIYKMLLTNNKTSNIPVKK